MPVLRKNDRVADEVADEGVEVAVAVDVGKVGIGAGPDVGQAEGVGGGGGEGRSGGCAGVSEDDREPVPLADHRVEVAVAVDVGKVGRGGAADVGEAEWVGGGGGEGRSAGRCRCCGRRSCCRTACRSKASRSPSPSMSAKVGRGIGPRRRPGRMGWWTAAAKAGASRARCCGRRSCCRRSSPTKASRSPSPSMSASVGRGSVPTSARPKGLVEAAAKAGAVAVPVLRKKIVLPSSCPTKASRSPSPSMSAKAGAALVPDVGQAEGVGRGAGEGRRGGGAGVAEDDRVAVGRRRSKASRSPSPSMSAKSATAEAPTSVRPKGLVDGGGERRRGGAAGVAEEDRVAEPLPIEGVEVAVAVDVGERRARQEPRRRPGRRGWWRGRRTPAPWPCRCCGRRSCCRARCR